MNLAKEQCLSATTTRTDQSVMTAGTPEMPASSVDNSAAVVYTSLMIISEPLQLHRSIIINLVQ